MSDWCKYKLGDLLKIKHGYAFTGSDFTLQPTGIVVVTPGNFNIGGGFKKGKLKYHKGTRIPENYIFQPNDLVVTMTDLSQEGDTLGYSAMIPNDGLTYLHNQRIGLVHSINLQKTIPEFLFWLMRTYDYQGYVLSACTGTSIKHTSPTLIYGYEFLLPPLPEQQAIAEVLNSLDDKIDLLHRNNKTLETMAETLFRQWFVEEADDSWEEKPLDKIADYLNGLALQKFPPKQGSLTLPAVKIREMNQGITENTDRCDASLPDRYIVNNGDILFSWSGSLDVIVWTGGRGALNQHLFKVTSEEYPKWLIYFVTRFFLPEFRDIANDKATTMGHIQRGHLTQSRFKLPDRHIIKQKDTVISEFFVKLINNKLQIRQLETVRNTLLPKLMNGAVKVEHLVLS